MNGFIIKKKFWDALKNESDWIIADVIKGLAAEKFGEKPPMLNSYIQLALKFIKAYEVDDEEASAKLSEE